MLLNLGYLNSSQTFGSLQFSRCYPGIRYPAVVQLHGCQAQILLIARPSQSCKGGAAKIFFCQGLRLASSVCLLLRKEMKHKLFRVICCSATRPFLLENRSEEKEKR